MESRSIGETAAVAASFVQNLVPEKACATVVGLQGDLGSGKTTFVQAVAHALGVEGVVTSPTFVIEKIYKVSHPHFHHLVHIDAYRLESGSELRALGWDALVRDARNLILVEWPERVQDTLPEHAQTVAFLCINETTRAITLPHA